jgi:hypothetical protein
VPEASGITFDNRRKDAAVRVDVGIDTPFKPFGLWQLQESLRRRRVYANVRIDNGRLRLELPHIGAASEELTREELTGFVATAFEQNLIGDEANAQAHTPVKPITVFRKTGEVALDPLAVVTTRQLSHYMADLSHTRKFDGSWSGVLAGSWNTSVIGRDYLCVSFDTPGIAVDTFAQAFDTSFAGSCTVSIQAFDTQPGNLLFSLEYGGSFPLNLVRAEAFGFSGIQKHPGTPHIVMAVVRRAAHQDPARAHEQNLWNAIMFAQSLGCHPVGEIAVLWDEYNRSVRKLGPLGNGIKTVSPSQ